MPSPVIRSLRTTSTRRLVVACLAAVAAGGSATAIAIAATSSGEVPPAKALAAAVHDALTAPEVEGVTARITFTNKMLDGGSVHGGNPLLMGASGRLWLGAGDRFRLELQSDGGDAQIFSDGRNVTVYDGTSNQAWTLKLPKHKGARKAEREHRVPTVARIQKAINRLVKHVGVSGALPTNVGGQPAYTLRMTPKAGEGGLVAAAELAWDAVRGAPLRAAIYAVGNDSPVLELAVDEIEYGPVAAGAFSVTLPEGAEVTRIKQGKHARKAKRLHGKRGNGKRLVRGLEAVAAKLPFELSAPAVLAGMKRSGVKLLDWGKHPAALVTYGEGLGGIAVVQRAVVAAEEKAKARKQKGSERDWHGDEGFELPTTDIGGAQAQVLPTALGTAVTFDRAGVHYLVVGSVRQDDAVAAARGL